MAIDTIEGILHFDATRGFLREGYPGYRFGSFAEFVLHYGARFTEFGKVARADMGRRQQCYANAFNMVVMDPRSLVYVEGYIWAVDLPITISHAWVVGKDGIALEPTPLIDHRGSPWQYFGVPFKYQYIMELAMKRGHIGSVIDDYRAKWPLIKGTHRPERFLSSVQIGQKEHTQNGTKDTTANRTRCKASRESGRQSAHAIDACVEASRNQPPNLRE
jgi:hypothetical protein